MGGDWVTFERRRDVACICSAPGPHKRFWKSSFYYLDDRCLPLNMEWRMPDNPIHDVKPKEKVLKSQNFLTLSEISHPIKEFPEIVLVLSRISRQWNHPTKWPVLTYNGEEMGLLKAIELNILENVKEGQVDLESNEAFLSQTQSSFEPIRVPVSNVTTPTVAMTTTVGETSVFGNFSPDPEVNNLALISGVTSPSIDSLVVSIERDMGATLPPISEDASQSLAQIISSLNATITPIPAQAKAQLPPKAKGKRPLKTSKSETSAIVKKTRHSPRLSGTNKFPPITEEHASDTVSLEDSEESEQENVIVKAKPSPKSTVSSLPKGTSQLATVTLSPQAWLENETSLMAKRTKITKNLKRSELSSLFIPQWDVANNSKCANPLVAKKLVLFGSTPADIAGAQSLSDEEFSHRVMTNQAENDNLLADLYARWICAKNKLLTMDASSLENENQLLLARSRKAEANSRRTELDLQTLEKKYDSQVQNLEQLVKNSQEEASALSKEVFVLKTNENLHLKNLADRDVQIKELQAKVTELEKEKALADAHFQELQEEKAFSDARSLKLREERTWLLTAGVKYVIDYVHKNSPIIDVISKINEAIKVWSFSEGVRAGFQHAGRGNTTTATVKGFKADAKPAYDQALEEYDLISFDLADDLEVAAEEPLETIKQILSKYHASAPSTSK